MRFPRLAAVLGVLALIAAFALPVTPPASAAGVSFVRIFGASSAGANVPLAATPAGALEVVTEGQVNSFSANSATGPTATFTPTTVVSEHGAQLIVTGGPTGCTFDLQGSNDAGTTWFNITPSAVTCTSSTYTSVADKPAVLIRGNVVTLTGGTAPTVRLHYAGR